MHIHHVVPIEVKHLFPVLDQKLNELLSSLSEAEWDTYTIARKWRVKDLVAHLLDANLRTLSSARDRYHGDRPENIGGYSDLVNYLNRLNADWVQAFRRVSPQVLIELLDLTGKQYTKFMQSLDPWAEAIYPVSWAGEEIATNWFHVAREYTGKWIHQQQIRHAVGKDGGLLEPDLFHPFIATIMCGLPHTYHQVDVPTGTSIKVEVSGIADEWHINKTDEGWVLRKETRLQPDSTVLLDKETAWKLFSKGISPEEALPKATIAGNGDLGRIVLNMVSVMA